jgi:hypothetical protein
VVPRGLQLEERFVAPNALLYRHQPKDIVTPAQRWKENATRRGCTGSSGIFSSLSVSAFVDCWALRAGSDARDVREAAKKEKALEENTTRAECYLGLKMRQVGDLPPDCDTLANVTPPRWCRLTVKEICCGCGRFVALGRFGLPPPSIGGLAQLKARRSDGLDGMPLGRTQAQEFRDFFLRNCCMAATVRPAGFV